MPAGNRDARVPKFRELGFFFLVMTFLLFGIGEIAEIYATPMFIAAFAFLILSVIATYLNWRASRPTT